MSKLIMPWDVQLADSPIAPPVEKECEHTSIPVSFDRDAARGLSAEDVRKRWPRGYGTCTECGWQGVRYASFAHYLYGDW